MKFGRSLVIMALMLSASISMAATFRSLPLDSKAEFGATHVATITYTDLTSTNLDASSQVISNLCVLSAKQSLEMVAMVLVTPFVDTATNAHNSTTLSVGDTSSATAYLTSTELNSDGTEVYLKFGRNPVAGTSATSANVTNVIKATTTIYDYFSNAVVVVTNYAVATESQTRVTGITDTDAGVGAKVYTAANNLYFTFTGTSLYRMCNLDAGEVRCYFRLKDATKANP